MKTKCLLYLESYVVMYLATRCRPKQRWTDQRTLISRSLVEGLNIIKQIDDIL